MVEYWQGCLFRTITFVAGIIERDKPNPTYSLPVD